MLQLICCFKEKAAEIMQCEQDSLPIWYICVCVCAHVLDISVREFNKSFTIRVLDAKQKKAMCTFTILSVLSPSHVTVVTVEVCRVTICSDLLLFSQNLMLYLT